MDQGAIDLETSDQVRSGWAEAFAEMSANGDDRLLDVNVRCLRRKWL